MKKLTFLFIFLCLFLTGCIQRETKTSLLDEISDRNTIKVGIRVDTKPFGFVKNGQYQGFDIDIAKSISEEIFGDNSIEHIEFIPLKTSERISALAQNRVDMVIAAFSINERRKTVVDFSIPYYVAGQALMVPNSSRINSIEQLNDKSVAIVMGTTSEKTVRTFAPNATLIGAITYKDAFNFLKKGEVQAVLADDSMLYGILSENKGYKILSRRYTEEFYAIGFAKDEKSKTLKNRVNMHLKNMQQSGELNKIKQKWIPKNYPQRR